MVSLTVFSHMVSLIYAAALSPTEWDQAVGEIHAGFIQTQNGIVRSTSLAHADGISRSMIGTLLPTAEDTYHYYGKIDHVLQQVEDGPVGVVRTSDELVAPHRSTEFHMDWIRPNSIEDGLFARLTHDEYPVSFIVAGSRGTQPFDTEERVELFSALIPHLQQALGTQRHFTAIAERADGFGDAVQRLLHGVAFVTKDGKIVETNAAAERILLERDGLRSVDGRLTASISSDRRTLQGLLHRALDADMVRRGGAMVCQRISGKRAYVLHVLPVKASTVGVKARPSAVVLIVDPARHPVHAEQVLRQLYGLTKAEASVAELMLSGEGVQAISERLSLSTATVRTHLRAIFAKTATHRQAELVGLLSTIVPWLTEDQA
jgi:DNA-binding CsgD family transcriptional regulator/PAS domain-containing protein